MVQVPVVLQGSTSSSSPSLLNTPAKLVAAGEPLGCSVEGVSGQLKIKGRVVGALYIPEGVNVNLEMVCNGSAWCYSRYAKNNRAMASCQDEAKEAGLGLWADDDPMPPWEWRRR